VAETAKTGVADALLLISGRAMERRGKAMTVADPFSKPPVDVCIDAPRHLFAVTDLVAEEIRSCSKSNASHGTKPRY
jgi:hypothetical protein